MEISIETKQAKTHDQLDIAQVTKKTKKKKNINLLVLCAAATDTTAVGWIILDKYELHCGNNRQLCEAVRWCNIVVRAHTFRLYGI